MSAVDHSYNVIGIREDLTNILTVISPTETPIYSTLDKTKATATLHEWQTISLAAAAQNAQVEGFTATYASSTKSSRLSNYTQIFAKTVEVSETMQAVDLAGRSDELAFQTELRMKELVRDFEWNIINGTATAGDASGGDAREMAGIIAQLTANTLTAASAATVQTSLTEARYNGLLEDIFDNGGSPNVTYCNGFNKRAISAFTSPGYRNVSTDDKRLVANIDVYSSDFGMQEIILDRHVPKDTLLLLDTSMFKLPVLRAPKMSEMAKVGDGERAMIVAEFTLACLNQNSSGRYVGFATS